MASCIRIPSVVWWGTHKKAPITLSLLHTPWTKDFPLSQQTPYPQYSPNLSKKTLSHLSLRGEHPPPVQHLSQPCQTPVSAVRTILPWYWWSPSSIHINHTRSNESQSTSWGSYGQFHNVKGSLKGWQWKNTGLEVPCRPSFTISSNKILSIPY